VKPQQLRDGRACRIAQAISPGIALVPEKIVQNGCLNSQRRGQQIIHRHCDQDG